MKPSPGASHGKGRRITTNLINFKIRSITCYLIAYIIHLISFKIIFRRIIYSSWTIWLIFCNPGYSST